MESISHNNLITNEVPKMDLTCKVNCQIRTGWLYWNGGGGGGGGSKVVEV